jgi:hypothetical protein
VIAKKKPRFLMFSFVINLTLMILISSPQIYFLDNREVLDIKSLFLHVCVVYFFTDIFFISVVNQGGLSFLTVIIRFGIALSASFISIFTVEGVIESISSDANKTQTCKKSDLADDGKISTN